MIKVPTKAINFFNENISDIFDSGALAEGKWNQALAETSKDFVGSKLALPTNSNGTGLHAILVLLKHYYSMKNVIIQDNTMYGVKTIAITSGLNFVGYVCSDLQNHLMPTAKAVEEKLRSLDEPQETVFLLTHIGGWINPEIAEIVEVCKSFGCKVVEDCAHSFGATLNGKHSGTFGDAGVYSFYATKALPVGEGGLIVTNNCNLGEQLAKYLIYDRFDQVQEIGLNIRMSEMQALLAYAVIQETHEIIENKHTIAKRYIEICDKKGLNYLIPKDEKHYSNLYKFIVLSENENEMESLRRMKNTTSPVYDYLLDDKSNNIYKNHICLPIWYGLEDEVISATVSELESITT